MSKHFDLQTFTFNGHTLRTILIDGKLWFSTIDVAAALEISRNIATNSKRVLSDDEHRVLHYGDFHDAWDGVSAQVEHLFPTRPARGRTTRVLVVSESGLYKITLRAQRSNPAAKEFQNWVTQVVLPGIRKNGGYVLHEEKVETGEITAQQAEANLWKFFAARIAACDQIAGPIRKQSADIQQERLAVIEEQRALRDLLQRNDDKIKDLERRTGELAKKLSNVDWEKGELQKAKELIRKASDPNTYGPGR